MIFLIVVLVGVGLANPDAIAASEVVNQPMVPMQPPGQTPGGMTDNTIVTIISAVMSTVVGLVIATEKVTTYLGQRSTAAAQAAAQAPNPTPISFPPELSNKLSAMEAKMENVEGRLDRLEATTRSIEQNDRDNTKSLARVEGRLSDWSDRFERVEKILLGHFSNRI